MKKVFPLIGLGIVVGIFGFLKLNANEAALNKAAPDFSLKDPSGKTWTLAGQKGKWVVLEWVNLGCPFVRKHYNSMNMQKLQKKWTGKGVVWLSICSSAEDRQGYYEPEDWKKLISERKIASSAVLLDPEGEVGQAYGAKTTPHMFVINPEGTLVYKGAIDDKPTTDTDDIKGANNYVDAALTEGMAGKKISMPVTRSYGCSVKYK